MGKFNDKRLDKRALKLSALLYAGEAEQHSRDFANRSRTKRCLSIIE